MKEKASWLSPVVFAMAAMCFLLPFMHLGFKGQKVLTLAGYQAVTGVKPAAAASPKALPEKFSGGKTGADPLAGITLTLIVLGSIAGLVRKREAALVSLVSAGAGTVSLLMLKSRMDADALSRAAGLLKVRYAYGFWILLACLTLSVVLNAWIFSGYGEECHAPGRFIPCPEMDTDED